MADDKPKVLLIEDSPTPAIMYAGHLQQEQVEVTHVETGKAALEIIDREPPAALLLDLGLPAMDGMDILRHVTEANLPTAAIVITAQGSINVAVEAMRTGAYDLLVKPFSADRLTVTLRNALERSQLTQIVQSYRDDFDRERFHGFIGQSLAMQAVYRIIDSAAQSKATVFITGESGTGKEVCAEAIHRSSPRAERPFVPINCAAIPKELIESEIFGHIKGSFTGAIADRDGAATQANGGTLFLDEVAEMDPSLQTKLLRFIQTGTFQRLGSSRQETVDIRLICATNRDPLAEVAAGNFREDLYYRLHVIPVHLPRLAERDDDTLAIARHFLQAFAEEEGKSFSAFDPAVESVLLGYAWPGNVRQLQNVIRNVVVLHDGEAVTADMLPPLVDAAGGDAAPPEVAPVPDSVPPPGPNGGGALGEADIEPLWLIEKRAIETAIDACGGNIPNAANRLGVAVSTIYRKRQAWNEKAAS